MELIKEFKKPGVTVAHYTRLENLANILHDKRLLLNQVCKTADSRESSLDWIELTGYGDFNYKSWASAQSQKKAIGRNLRILSTAIASDITDSFECPIENLHCGKPRMWAQYADGFKGFCIILNTKRIEESIKSIAKKDEYLTSKPVEYTNLQDINCSVEIPYGNGITLTDTFELISENEDWKSIYFKKSKDWQGENEHRWLLYDDSPDETFVSIEDSIEAVVLGNYFPINQIDVAKLYCKNLSCACLMLKYNNPRYDLELLQER